MKNVSKLAVLCVSVLVLAISVSKASFAYFTATVTGNDAATTTNVTTGTMKITFADGAAISKTNWVPGDSLTKTFTVTNTGSLTANYSISFISVSSTLADATDFVYTLSSTNSGASKTETVIPTTDGKIVESATIAPATTQTYTLTVTFKSLDTTDQSDNQGKSWSAKVQVNG